MNLWVTAPRETNEDNDNKDRNLLHRNSPCTFHIPDSHIQILKKKFTNDFKISKCLLCVDTFMFVKIFFAWETFLTHFTTIAFFTSVDSAMSQQIFTTWELCITYYTAVRLFTCVCPDMLSPIATTWKTFTAHAALITFPWHISFI